MRTGKRLILDNFWKYILVVALSIFIWSAVFEFLSQVKDNQRITVAVYNVECDTACLKEALTTMTDQEILELYVDALEHIPNQTYATDILTMQILQADLIVMPESLLNALDVALYFPALPESLCREGNYQIDEAQYGIRITAHSNFSAYCTNEEPCYLLLSSQSVNLGTLLGRGAIEDDAAIRIMEYLLEEVAQ